MHDGQRLLRIAGQIAFAFKKRLHEFFATEEFKHFCLPFTTNGDYSMVGFNEFKILRKSLKPDINVKYSSFQ